jgi:hypothetical protein
MLEKSSAQCSSFCAVHGRFAPVLLGLYRHMVYTKVTEQAPQYGPSLVRHYLTYNKRKALGSRGLFLSPAEIYALQLTHLQTIQTWYR